MNNQKANEFLGESWGLILLRGILVILFGLTALAWPGLTFVTLLKLFSLYVLVAGVISFIMGLFSIGKKKTWYLDILKGMFAFGIGLVALNHTGYTAVFVGLMIGVYAIAEAIVDFVTLYEYRHNLDHKFLLGLSGAVSLLFGIAMILNPIIGTVIYVWVVGLMSLILGPIWIVLAFKTRKLGKEASSKK